MRPTARTTRTMIVIGMANPAREWSRAGIVNFLFRIAGSYPKMFLKKIEVVRENGSGSSSRGESLTLSVSRPISKPTIVDRSPGTAS